MIRVIYTSHYNNITSVHLVFFFFHKVWCKKYKTNKNTQKLKTHFKKYQQIVQPFFAFFCCISPCLIWRRQSGAVIDSGNADKSQIKEQIQLPLYELWMHLCKGVQADFFTAWIQARKDVLKACCVRMKYIFHFPCFLCHITSWRTGNCITVFKSTVY